MSEAQLALSLTAQHLFGFEQFVTGPNGLVVETLKALAQCLQPAQHLYFLYGPEGCGKTHLLKSLCESPHFTYLNAQTLTQPLLSYDVQRSYAIDQIEYLLPDSEGFFHFYNKVIDAGQTLVLSERGGPHRVLLAWVLCTF